MFSIHKSLFLALKNVESSKSLLLRFPTPGKNPPPVKFLIAPTEGDFPPTPYRYLENPWLSNQISSFRIGAH